MTRYLLTLLLLAGCEPEGSRVSQTSFSDQSPNVYCGDGVAVQVTHADGEVSISCKFKESE